MSWIDQAVMVLAALGIKLGVLVSSSVGGFLSLRFFDGAPGPDGTTVPVPTRQKWIIAFSGGAMGVFLSGAAVELFDLPNASGRVEIGLGVVIALFGMAVAAKFIEAIRQTDFAAVFQSWFQRSK